MKLAFVCHGEAKGLRYLGDSVQEVKTFLKLQGWICCDISELKSVQHYHKTLQNSVKDRDISEYLFYYVGHGDYSVDLDFHLCLSEDTNQPTIGHFIDKNNDISLLKNATKAIVVDACYSGEASKEYIRKDYNNQYELLTATNNALATFEANNLKYTYNDVPNTVEVNMSIFSYFFCHAYKDLKEEYNFLDLSKYIRSLKDITILGTSIDLKPNYFQNQNQSLIYLSSSLLIDIQKILETKQDLYDSVVMYYYGTKNLFALMHTDFSKFMHEILQDKQLLYSLSKHYGISNPYTEILNVMHTDCTLSQKFKMIVFKIYIDKNDIFSIDCFLVYSNYKVQKYIYEDKIDTTFTSIDAVLNNIKMRVEAIYCNESKSSNKIEVKFILTESLFEDDILLTGLEQLEIETGPLGGDPIGALAGISYKLAQRYENIEQDAFKNYTDNWKNNTNNLKDDDNLDNDSICTESCDRFNDKKEYLLKKDTMLFNEHILIEHIKYGIPLSLSCQEIVNGSFCKLKTLNAYIYNEQRDRKICYINDRFDEAKLIAYAENNNPIGDTT